MLGGVAKVAYSAAFVFLHRAFAMLFVIILIVAIVLVLVCGIIGGLLLIRFLTSEGRSEDRLKFDPFGPPRSFPARFFELMVPWRKRRLELTYRRDGLGRFRKTKR